MSSQAQCLQLIVEFQEILPLSPQVCIDDRADKQPDDCADVRTKRLAIPVTYDVAHSLADAQPVGNSVWQPDRGTNDKPPKHHELPTN